jgi:dihydroneopterin aldolase
VTSGTVPDRIELRGLRTLGRHGVLDEERVRAQPFEVDLDLELDLRAAGRGDSLADTVDYGAVAQSVADTVQGEHSDLLEHLAERIARVVLAAGSSAGAPDAPDASGGAGGQGPAVTVAAVTVAVRKLRPPVPVDMASAGVRIHRRREDLR